MSETKHTPGPWTAEEVRDWSIRGNDEDDVVTMKATGWINGPDGKPVVEYAGCGSHEAEWPNPADKLLVLATPNLFSALQTAIRWLRRLEQEYPGCLNDDAIDKHLSPAIAKATGEDVK